MKNTLKTLLAVAVLGAASLANAALIPNNSGELDLFQTDNDGDLAGGEFRLEFDNDAVAYSFCLEPTVSLDGGNTFLYNLVDGITNGTAYLVKKFSTNQLYVRDSSATHDAEAGKLQNAIWYLETNGTEGAYNVYVDMVDDMLDYLGTYDGGEVKRVDLIAKKDSQGNWVKGSFQDQVIYVPDSGATLALLGLALAGLAIVHRRR